MDYRQRLRDIREDRDLTQAEIGKLLNKSQQGYNHIEIGRAELKIEDLITLCQFYNLSADYIIGLVNKPTSFKQKSRETEGRFSRPLSPSVILFPCKCIYKPQS